MPNQAANRITRLSPKIMQRWQERTSSEIAASNEQSTLALQDSLPDFIASLSNALSTTIDRTKVRIKWDRDENERLGRKHGHERAGMSNYTMDQLIFEYHILRQVICEVMEEEQILTPIEREVIVCAVEQAVNDAATQYSATFTDIREKFTNTLAHDMRSPITSAKLCAQILIKRPDNAEQCLKVAHRIQNSMDRLDLMIHDLLDASRLRAGEKLELALEECDLNAILTVVAEDFNFSQGHRVEYHVGSAVIGTWNEIGLRRIFDNLVNNALKFSPSESPVTIELKKLDRTVEVTVQNWGTTIPANEKAILFQQFRRTKTSEGKSGWGLGLTVVKGVTETLGGRVEVESESDTGTIFKVILPWAEVK